jgi:hypothetical protein
VGHPRTCQVFLVLARFAAYAATLYAIHATDWAHLAVAAIALALLPVVLYNHCRNHPPVWWPRELLIAYLATLAALQISGARWQLTAVAFAAHQAFSCTVWWTWPPPERSWRHPQPRSRGRIA